MRGTDRTWQIQGCDRRPPPRTPATALLPSPETRRGASRACARDTRRRLSCVAQRGCRSRGYRGGLLRRRAGSFLRLSEPRDALELDPLRLSKPRPQVADFLEPVRHRANRKRFAVDAVVDFAPRERRRYARIFAGAGAVGRRERLAGNVLQVVDVHLLTALFDHALDRRLFRVLLRDHRRNDLTEEHSRLIRGTGWQWYIDVEAFGA